jgi:hypothetical protein
MSDDVRRRPLASGLVTTSAVAIGVLYLLWRSIDTVQGVTAWLGAAVLAVEVAGVAGTTALLAALATPKPQPAGDVAAGTVEPVGGVDVVVRFDAQPVGHLHATLAGVRHMFDVHRITIVTERIDDAIKAARGTAATVVAADRNDLSRLGVAGHSGEAPFVAVLDAGDVPLPGFTGALRSHFIDPDVAVVQAGSKPDSVDSAEHDPRGRHEMRFERSVLNPAMGARGGAVLLGSGAMIRRSVLQSVAVPSGARRTIELRWSVRVAAARHRLVAPAAPVMSTASINTARAASAERRRTTRAVLVTLASPQSPLWALHLGLGRRVGYMAWMVRPLSGLRRLAFVGLLIGCAVSGDTPAIAQSAAWILGGLWLAWFVLQGWAIERASEGVLQPGDRARFSLRIMGASVAALMSAGRRPLGDEVDARRTPFLLFALFALAVAAVAMAVDRWAPFLPSIGTEVSWVRAIGAAVAVWTIAMTLDVMRSLIGGPQLRATQRLQVGLQASVDQAAASIINLSPRGAGLRFDDEPDLIVGDQVTMRFLVPTGSGTTAEVATIATIRSIIADDGQPQLSCGVEFGAMDRVSADALFAYCAVVHPGQMQAAPPVDVSRSELVVGAVSGQRSGAVRVLGALALLGLGAAMMPPYGAVDAAEPDGHGSIMVHLIDAASGEGVEGATVSATCVSGASVVDDRDRVFELASAAVDSTRALQRQRAAAAENQAEARNSRRLTVTTPQSQQASRWFHSAEVPMEQPLTDAGAGPEAVGWHHVPAVATVEAVLTARDAGNGDYPVVDVPGRPCRVDVTTLPPGYSPVDGLTQFVGGGADATTFVVTAITPTEVQIGDRVWLDENGDGVQDAAEPGLPDVPVTLTIGGAQYVATTDQLGRYRFSSVQIADLQVGSIAQITVAPTIARGGTTLHLVAGIAAAPFTIATVNPGVGLGFTQLHRLGDLVWSDTDNDGLVGPTEAGVDHVTVLLYLDADANGVPDGDPLDAQVTADGGHYAFDGLPAGTYVVDVHPPEGMVSSTGAIGSIDGPYEPNLNAGPVDGDDDGLQLATGVIRSSTVTLIDGAEPTADFGLFAPRSVDDAVWLDLDGNGLSSPDEPGVADVPMRLFSGDQLLAATVTDAQGDFVFPNLTIGDYTVQLDAPTGQRPIAQLPELNEDGDLPGEPETLPTETVPAEDVPAEDVPLETIVLESGQTLVLQPQPTETTEPPPEPGPTPVPAAAPTPADDPAVETIALTIAPDWAGPDSNRTLQRFGLWVPHSIGDRVWEDADDDGMIDQGEAGVPGVPVVLLDGDRVVARTVSAADGSYRFVDLPDGTYRVGVDVPVSWRTSSLGSSDPLQQYDRVDNAIQTHAVGRAVSQPMLLQRVATDAAGVFDRIDIGIFQPRPALTVQATVHGCDASDATGGTGPRGTCVGATGTANPVLAAGSTVTVEYIVANTGNAPLSEVTVDDDMAASATIDCNGAAPGDGQPLLLPVATSITCAASARIVAGQDGATANVQASAERSAAGAPGPAEPLDAVTDTTNWFGTTPGLAMRAFVTLTSPGADTGVLPVGATPQLTPLDDSPLPGGTDPTANHVVTDGTQIWRVYEVANTGTGALDDVGVIDQQRGRVCGNLSLAPGERRYCVLAEVLQRSTGNPEGQARVVASASGTDVTDPMVRVPSATVSDAAHVFVATEAVQVTVAIDGVAVPSDPTSPVSITAGTTPRVEYSVTNAGQTTVTRIDMIDDSGQALQCPQLDLGRDGLQPGQTVGCIVARAIPAPEPVAAPADAPVVPADPVVHAVRVEATGGGEPMVIETRWSTVTTTLQLADAVYVDANVDGVHDAGEAPVAGVQVDLLDHDQQIVATTTTDELGRWRFTSLPSGTYTVRYVVPQGRFVAVRTDQVHVVRPAEDGVVITAAVLLDGVVAPPALSLALVEAVSVAGQLEGVEGADAAGVAITVTDPRGVTVARTQTAGDGTWSASGLLPGSYSATISASAGRTLQLIDGRSTLTTVGQIEDRVWDDVDGDGAVTAGDAGLAGVVVTLVDVSQQVATPVAVTVSDVVGRYRFTDVPAGSWMIAVGQVAAGASAESLTGVASDGRQPQRPLTIGPAERPLVAPGRATALASAGDDGGLVPTTLLEALQAAVFVLSIVTVSVVLGTARRRRPM